MPKTDRKKTLTVISKSILSQAVTLLTLLAFSAVTTAGCSRKKSAESNQAEGAASSEKQLELGLGGFKIAVSGQVPDVGQMVNSAKESAKNTLDNAIALKAQVLDGNSEVAIAGAQNLKQKALSMAEKLPEEDLGKVAAIIETIKKTLGDLADGASDSLAGEDSADSATDKIYQKTAELLQKNKALAAKEKALVKKDELIKSLSESQDEMKDKFSKLAQKMSREKLASVIKGLWDFSGKEAGLSEKEQEKAAFEAVKIVSADAQAGREEPQKRAGKAEARAIAATGATPLAEEAVTDDAETETKEPGVIAEVIGTTLVVIIAVPLCLAVGVIAFLAFLPYAGYFFQ